MAEFAFQYYILPEQILLGTKLVQNDGKLTYPKQVIHILSFLMFSPNNAFKRNFSFSGFQVSCSECRKDFTVCYEYGSWTKYQQVSSY